MARKNANGEGSIYRANGRWVGVVSLGYQRGKRRRRAIYGTTREELAKKVRKILSAKDDGRVIPTGSQTVGQFIARWLNDVVRSGNAPQTYRAYERIARLHVTPELGAIQLSKLTAQEVQAFLTKKLKDDGMSPRSVESYRTLLVTALGQAEKWDLVPRNVASRTERPYVPKREVNPFTVNEARQFLQIVKDEPLGAMFVLAELEGLRRAEFLGLRWKDADLEKREVRVCGALQRVDGTNRLVPAKSGKSRKLEIGEIAKDALMRRRTFQLEEKLAAGGAWSNKLDLIFTTRNGTPLEASVPNRIMDRLLKKAGIRHLSPHGLRHSCATLMMAAGENAKVIAEKLGHSTTAFTLDVYAHVGPTLQEEASARMDQRMGWKR